MGGVTGKAAHRDSDLSTNGTIVENAFRTSPGTEEGTEIEPRHSCSGLGAGFSRKLVNSGKEAHRLWFLADHIGQMCGSPLLAPASCSAIYPGCHEINAKRS